MTEYCQNCNRVISQSEQAFVYKDRIVCQQCEELLRTGSNKKIGLLKRYKKWCGTKSFNYQVALLAWTAFMFFAGIVLLMSATEGGSNVDETGTAIGCCCPLATWLLIAIPLAIGAFVNIKEGG